MAGGRAKSRQVTGPGAATRPVVPAGPPVIGAPVRAECGKRPRALRTPTDGCQAEGASTGKEARGLLESARFEMLIVGGGVEPDTRAALEESRRSTGCGG